MLPSNLGCHIKYHNLSDLNNRHLSLTVLEVGSLRSRWQGQLLKTSWPVDNCLLMCAHRVKRQQANPIMGPILMTSSNPKHLPKAPSPNTMTLGVRVSAYKYFGGKNILSITLAGIPRLSGFHEDWEQQLSQVIFPWKENGILLIFYSHTKDCPKPFTWLD